MLNCRADDDDDDDNYAVSDQPQQQQQHDFICVVCVMGSEVMTKSWKTKANEKLKGEPTLFNIYWRYKSFLRVVFAAFMLCY